jgi:hypothetical protein
VTSPQPRRAPCDPARLEAFIRDAGLSFRLTTKSFVFSCPLCGDEEMLWMYRHDGRFKCWKCAETKQFRGAPEFALRELTGQPITVVRAALYGAESVPASLYLDVRFGDLVTDDDAELLEDVKVEEDLPDRRWPYHSRPIDHRDAERGAEYLAGRGIPLELAKEYGIRYFPQKRAVAFPAYVGERLVGWQYRIVYPERQIATVIHADGAPVRVGVKNLKIWSDDGDAASPDDMAPWRDRCVMFANRLQVAEHAVLCEGPVDALKAHLVGGNVASMGKAVSLGQINYLLNAGVRKLYVALDPDAAAEIEPLLRKFEEVPAFQVRLPKGAKDLGAMSLEAARDAILAAQPYKRGRVQIYLKGIGLVSDPDPVV